MSCDFITLVPSLRDSSLTSPLPPTGPFQHHQFGPHGDVDRWKHWTLRQLDRLCWLGRLGRHEVDHTMHQTSASETAVFIYSTSHFDINTLGTHGSVDEQCFRRAF